MSFFDDGEETAPRGQQARVAAYAAATPAAPSPAREGSLPLDQHTLMVRRRVAAGVGVVLLIVIVLIVNGCLKSQKTQALERLQPRCEPDRDRNPTSRSHSRSSRRSPAPARKSALDVEVQLDQLHIQAQRPRPPARRA